MRNVKQQGSDGVTWWVINNTKYTSFGPRRRLEATLGTAQHFRISEFVPNRLAPASALTKFSLRLRQPQGSHAESPGGGVALDFLLEGAWGDGWAANYSW